MTELEVVTIDCDYLQPRFAAAFLCAAGGEAVVIETNTSRAVPRILAAMASHGVRPEQVRWIIVTHVHLDHAGGASELLRNCPNAQVVAHPRAARHLIDPSKLVRSAQAVYGEEEFVRLYGRIDPIEEKRVLALEDEAEIPFGRGRLRFLHTRGHANHHFCVWDALRGAVFTGDSFGLAYPKLQKNGLFILPSTSPTDFDPAAARASVQRIAQLGARRAYLTHFGPVSSIEAAAEQLIEHLDASERILNWAVRQNVDDAKLIAHCEQDLRDYYYAYAERKRLGLGQPGSADWKLLDLDFRLNAQGIVAAARRIRDASNK